MSRHSPAPRVPTGQPLIPGRRGRALLRRRHRDSHHPGRGDGRGDAETGGASGGSSLMMRMRMMSG